MKTKINFIRGIVVGIVVAAIAAAGAYAYDQPVTNPNTFELACAASATRIGSTSMSDSFIIGNPSATAVYIGGSDVTTATGFPICTTTTTCTQSSFSADAFGGEFYCIVASGTVNTRVLEGSKS